MKTIIKTERIEKNGNRVSITPNIKERNGVTYQSFLIRATILGERKTMTAPTLKEARDKANGILDQIVAKGGVVATYSPAQVAVIESALEICTKAKVTLTKAVSEYSEALQHLPQGVSLIEAVREFAKLRDREELIPISVAALVEKFLESRRKKDVGELHMKSLSQRLERAAQHFRCNIGDITSQDIDQWIESLEVGPLTRNHHRTSLVSLFRYAQSQKFLKREGRTEADYAATSRVKETAIEAYTPKDAAFLLANVEKRWQPYVAISLFAGVRSQELFRLEWSDVKTDHIEVSAKNSKLGERRIVPITENLSAWLKTFSQKKGPVAPVFAGGNASRSQSLSQNIRDTAEAGGFKPINNGLRHSFISYRVATIQNFPQVAYEAGNSVEVIKNHYNKAVTPTDAKRFFSIKPSLPENVVSFAAA